MYFDKFQLVSAVRTTSYGLPVEQVFVRQCLLAGQNLINPRSNNCSVLQNQAVMHFHTGLLETSRHKPLILVNHLHKLQ